MNVFAKISVAVALACVSAGSAWAQEYPQPNERAGVDQRASSANCPTEMFTFSVPVASDNASASNSARTVISGHNGTHFGRMTVCNESQLTLGVYFREGSAGTEHMPSETCMHVVGNQISLAAFPAQESTFPAQDDGTTTAVCVRFY